MSLTGSMRILFKSIKYVFLFTIFPRLMCLIFPYNFIPKEKYRWKDHYQYMKFSGSLSLDVIAIKEAGSKVILVQMST